MKTLLLIIFAALVVAEAQETFHLQPVKKLEKGEVVCSAYAVQNGAVLRFQTKLGNRLVIKRVNLRLKVVDFGSEGLPKLVSVGRNEKTKEGTFDFYTSMSEENLPPCLAALQRSR